MSIRAKIKTREEINVIFNYLWQLLLVIYSSMLNMFRIIGSFNSQLIVAIIVIWAGLVLRFWAVQTLGKFFRTTVMIQKEHRVIKMVLIAISVILPILVYCWLQSE